MERRRFLHRGTIGAFGALVGAPLLMADVRSLTSPSVKAPLGQDELRFVQRPLPNAYGSLEPHIEAETVRLHYGTHHTKYVEEANKDLASSALVPDTPEALFAGISTASLKLRSDAGGAWHHDFFRCNIRSTAAVHDMPGGLGDAFTASFGTRENFRAKFADEALSRSGSGWTWPVIANGKPEIGRMPKQDNPLMGDSPLSGAPIPGLDIWEHAYCLRYQKKRTDHISNWWNVVDRDTVAQRFSTPK